ncbi:MAG: signal peptidase II [Burkholderiales bacterium]|nr:signal peptidase II [Burkholderiales bacterium]
MRWAFGFWTAVVLMLDQITKAAIMDTMSLGQSLELPGGFLALTYIHNSGGAFGLFPQGGPFFLATAVVVVVGILWALPRLEHWGSWTAIACALILGGTLGNLIDRLRFGSVVDFLDLGWWPIFNVADSGISVGICVLLLQALFVRPPEESARPVPHDPLGSSSSAQAGPEA